MTPSGFIHDHGDRLVRIRIAGRELAVYRDDLVDLVGDRLTNCEIVDRRGCRVGLAFPSLDRRRIWFDIGGTWFAWTSDLGAMLFGGATTARLLAVHGMTTAPTAGNAGPLHA